jgi:hypothetical protein
VRIRIARLAAVTALLALPALAWLASGASAAPIDKRLAERLDPATAEEVWKVVEAAGSQGVPTDPLIVTALEGASKHARPERIVAAVRERAAALSAAREALGPESTPGEIAAGAGALLSGVPRDTLVRLRQERPKGSLLVPLVVLADLVTRQVPVETASMAVLHASRLGTGDADLLRLRSRVEGDIKRGVSPAAATIARLQTLGLGDAPTPPVRGTTR